MLKIIISVALAFALLWGGAYVTGLIPTRHWAGAPAFLTFYIACCGCITYAVVQAVKWHKARVTEKLSNIGPGT